MRRAALLVLVLPLVLVACGGSKSGTKELSPPEAVRQAATKTAKQSSEHVDLKGSVTVNGGSVLVTGKGDFKDRAGTMKLDFSVAGLSGSIDAVLQQTTLYVKSPLFADALANGKTWLKIDLAQAAQSAGVDLSRVAAQDPASTLAELRRLKQVRKIGSEDVDGAQATHYRGRLAKTATVPGGVYDVWVGDDDGYVHRVKASSALGPNQRLETTVDLSEFGKDVTVTVPPASETADATNLKIPGLGG